MAFLQRRAGLGDQGGDRLQYRFGPRDRFGEAPLRRDRLDRPARDDGRARVARQPPDRGRRLLAEARGDGGERPGHDIAHRLQPRARQGGRRLLVEPQRGDGQPPHRALLVRGRRAGEARERLRRLGRIAERMSHHHPAPRQPPLDIARQPAFVAVERMHAARDIEQQRIGRHDRDDRGIALAPVGEPFDPVEIGMRIVREHLERRHPRARIRQRQPGREPLLRRHPVDRDQPDRIAARLDKGDRHLIPSGEQMRPGRAQPLDRQPGEDERQVAARL